MSSDIIIKVENIKKSYGNKEVLKGVNLEIVEGDFVAIIGKSGSGKSTLLNLIGNLDIPDSGEIFYFKEKISNFNSGERAKFRNQNIGFIFQSFMLLSEFTVLENVLIPTWIKRGVDTGEAKKKASRLLEYMGLGGYENRCISELSGGEMQRVAIVRAMINEPNIILADEPTGNLDSVTTVEIYKMLKKINKDYGTTFIMVTHDNEIASLCNRVIKVKDGIIE